MKILTKLYHDAIYVMSDLHSVVAILAAVFLLIIGLSVLLS